VRNLFLFLLLLGGIWYVRRALHRWVASQTKAEDPVRPPSSLPLAENMVPCCHCGLHLPESEAIQSAEGFYCNATHRDAGPGSKGGLRL
jgi:uncharacterized protein